MNFLELLNKFPPYVCRIVAVRANGRKWRSCRDIAKASGLSIQRVAEISMLKVWDDLPCKTASAFQRGCAVDLGSYRGRARIIHMLSRGMMCHLRNLTKHQQQFLARLYALHD